MNKKPENSGFSPLEAPLSMRFSIRKVESFFFDIWIQHENSTNRVATNVVFRDFYGKIVEIRNTSQVKNMQIFRFLEKKQPLLGIIY